MPKARRTPGRPPCRARSFVGTGARSALVPTKTHLASTTPAAATGQGGRGRSRATARRATAEATYGSLRAMRAPCPGARALRPADGDLGEPSSPWRAARAEAAGPKRERSAQRRRRHRRRRAERGAGCRQASRQRRARARQPPGAVAGRKPKAWNGRAGRPPILRASRRQER